MTSRRILLASLCFAQSAYSLAASPTMTDLSGNSLPSHSGVQEPVFHGPPPRIVRMYTAHAILACLAWAAVFPIGGIMIRLLSFPRLLWVHAGFQIFGFCMYIVAIGLGVELSINPRYWHLNNKHVIMGLLIFVLFFFQSLTGYLHHANFKKYISRNVWSYIHLWTGRVCITLGIVNAGFGFEITHKGTDSWQVFTYSVIAVVVWVGYAVSIFVGELRGKKAAAQSLSADSARRKSLESGALEKKEKEFSNKEGRRQCALVEEIV
ncbi:uncharacterized protein BDR25DRAFT_370338 [Lindgomyces ingoldianus]|uniref:Uncharacterized protein n=1 Tax=Lindgomyces ingoldianus TaxID=673940 RepID=A0ACB6QS14_9PLEO|nr:uncharacterized protein BDR25DRAFT_370338 [Lindgomyces ingoldianus]KAF2469726.1 hypothetical protein BDR25DRAFT_370338 [Lindgomyces ingoldianus]